jgi:hypothetical protein
MARNVFALLDEIGSAVSKLKGALAPLAAFAGAARPATRRRRRTVAVPKSAPKSARRRKVVSAAVKAKRILQGKYLAAIRPLTKAQRVKVKTIQAKKGHEAAIRAASLLRS